MVDSYSVSSSNSETTIRVPSPLGWPRIWTHAEGRTLNHSLQLHPEGGTWWRDVVESRAPRTPGRAAEEDSLVILSHKASHQPLLWERRRQRQCFSQTGVLEATNGASGARGRSDQQRFSGEGKGRRKTPTDEEGLQEWVPLGPQADPP